MHILTNISISIDNQAMIFGQSTEHNMKNIFLEQLCTKCVKNIHIGFSKISKLDISLDQ